MSYIVEKLVCPRCYAEKGFVNQTFTIWHRQKSPYELTICNRCGWIWDEVKSDMLILSTLWDESKK